MAWYGDPDVLDAHARRLGADADGVRARAQALEASVAQLRWQGQGADAFRRTVEQDADHLHRAARELDEAAAAMRAHAADVRARLAQIRELERAVSGWFDDQLRALPAAGDKAWLEVGDYLRGRGVRL